MNATILAPAPAPAGTRYCHWCSLPIMVCPVLAEGFLTYCGGWVHVPAPGRRFGRHSCGLDGGGSTASPERLRRKSNA